MQERDREEGYHEALTKEIRDNRGLLTIKEYEDATTPQHGEQGTAKCICRSVRYTESHCQGGKGLKQGDKSPYSTHARRLCGKNQVDDERDGK